MEQVKWVWNYMKGKRAVFMGGLFLTVVTSAIRVVNALLGKKIIDVVIIGRDTSPLIRILVIMMIVQLTRLGLNYLQIILMEIASTDVLTALGATCIRLSSGRTINF